MKITLRNLSKVYGKARALDDISMEIGPAQIVSVIGLNGAGKTTLLRCLSGIVSPTRGEVRYDEELFRRSKMDLRRRLVFLPDFPPLYAHMNVLQHIALMLRVYERETEDINEIVIGLLHDFDLLPLAETPLGNLSRGQIYKAAFVALVAVQPELWLLDEPFASGLDPQGLAMLKQYARTAAAAGATIFYTTQILEIAEKFADLLVVLDHGGLRATYSRAELAALPSSGPDSLEFRLRQFREVPA